MAPAVSRLDFAADRSVDGVAAAAADDEAESDDAPQQRILEAAIVPEESSGRVLDHGDCQEAGNEASGDTRPQAKRQQDAANKFDQPDDQRHRGRIADALEELAGGFK